MGKLRGARKVLLMPGIGSSHTTSEMWKKKVARSRKRRNLKIRMFLRIIEQMD